MKVKKFIKYNICISLTFIILLVIFSFIYNTYMDSRIKKFNLYNKYDKKSIKIVNVGSSHGMLGIIYEKKNMMNLALAAQNFYYDLKLLEKYTNKIENNAIEKIKI